MIKLKCPSCAKPLGIDAAYVGMPALCPGCGVMFTVPALAVLLEDQPPPAPALPPLPPGETLLPEGLVGLAPDSKTGAAMAGVPFGGAPDPWASAESRQRSPAPLPDVGLLPLGPSPSPTPPQGNRAMSDWRFLALEEDEAPAAPPPLPRAEPPPATAAVPLFLPPALAADKVLVPVNLGEAGSYDMQAPAAPAEGIPELPLAPGDAVAAQPLLALALPPLPEGLLPPPAPVPDDGRARKRKRSDGAQLIPGVDNAFLCLAGLGVLWVGLLVVVLLAPQLFLLPLLLGLAVWGAGGLKVRPRIEVEDGDWWLTLPFQPLALLVYPVVQRKAVGPFLVLLAGLLLVLTGVVGMAKDFETPPPGQRMVPGIQRP